MSIVKTAEAIGQLNAVCLDLFNKAGDIARNTGGRIEPEQVIGEASKLAGSDIDLIFKHYGKESFTASFESQNPFGYSPVTMGGKPGVSEEMIMALAIASSIGLIKYRCPATRTGFILLAYLDQATLKRRDRAGHLSRGIDVDDLASKYREITAKSIESDTPSSWAVDGQTGFKTSAQSAFAVDLTESARNGELDPVIGREDEIRQAINILCRRRQNNPALIGPAGVGKTAIVEGIAARIVSGNVPKQLEDHTILSLDMGALAAGTGQRGSLEERITSVINNVSSSKAILFIDEMHLIVGSPMPGMPDMANLIKPAMSRGKFRVIGATTFGEYKSSVERDAALSRRFQPVTVNEPGDEDAILMVGGFKSILEDHHDKSISEDAITASVRLSRRHLPERRLPDKAITLLDDACVRAGTVVTPEDVAATVADWTGLPLSRVLRDGDEGSRVALDLSEFRRDVAATVGDTVNDRYAKSLPPAFLIYGAPAAAASLGSALATELFGSAKKFVNINMADYHEPHSISSLRGSPPGYHGSLEGGFLTEKVRRQPGTVFLARSIHLASRQVVEFFREICETGVTRDGIGNEIDFTRSVILISTEMDNYPNHFDGAVSLRVEGKPSIIVP